MTTHNIEYYANLWDKYERFQDDNASRQKNAKYLNPHHYVINPIADFAADLVFVPTKWAYHTTGRVLAGAAKILDSKLASRVEEAWLDPISTETMLKIGKWIQSKARVHAVRKPTSVPFFHFFDKAFIAFSQHTYVVATDLNALLQIPRGLHRYLNSGAKEAGDTQTPTTLFGRAWQYVKIGTSKAKEALYALIQLVVQAVKVPLKHLPGVEKALERAGKALEEVRNKIHNYLLNKAHDLIDLGEKKARHQVAARVSNIVARQTIRTTISIGLHVAVGASAYLLANHLFTQFTGAQEFPPEMVKSASRVLKVAGGYLWVRCITPTIRDLYADYKEDFNPDSSTLVEFSNLLDTRNIRPLFKLAKKKLL